MDRPVCVESASGGLLSSYFTDTPGASEWFAGGMVAYTAALKVASGVPQEIIDQQTAPWGVKVSVVEVKDVEIPQSMQRAMARQAEAERERRAKIIGAEAEFQASEKLSQAAAVLAEHPTSLQLRYLQTLLEIGAANNSTILFPIPIDLLEPFTQVARKFADMPSDGAPERR